MGYAVMKEAHKIRIDKGLGTDIPSPPMGKKLHSASMDVPGEVWDRFQVGIGLPSWMRRNRAYTAAMLMFMAADPHEQLQWIHAGEAFFASSPPERLAQARDAIRAALDRLGPDRDGLSSDPARPKKKPRRAGHQSGGR